MAKAHDPDHAKLLGGRMGQLLPPALTNEQINDLLHNPERLQAHLSGLTQLVPGHTIDFERKDGGVTKGVALAGGWDEAARAFNAREAEGSSELPMLESLNDENSAASVEQVKRTRRSGGCELPPEIVD
jgi:hypothetical protein